MGLSSNCSLTIIILTTLLTLLDLGTPLTLTIISFFNFARTIPPCSVLIILASYILPTIDGLTSNQELIFRIFLFKISTILVSSAHLSIKIK